MGLWITLGQAESGRVGHSGEPILWRTCAKHLLSMDSEGVPFMTLFEAMAAAEEGAGIEWVEGTPGAGLPWWRGMVAGKLRWRISEEVLQD